MPRRRPERVWLSQQEKVERKARLLEHDALFRAIHNVSLTAKRVGIRKMLEQILDDIIKGQISPQRRASLERYYLGRTVQAQPQRVESQLPKKSKKEPHKLSRKPPAAEEARERRISELWENDALYRALFDMLYKTQDAHERIQLEAYLERIIERTMPPQVRALLEKKFLQKE